MCLIFDESLSNSLTRYYIILWRLPFPYSSIPNFARSDFLKLLILYIQFISCLECYYLCNFTLQMWDKSFMHVRFSTALLWYSLSLLAVLCTIISCVTTTLSSFWFYYLYYTLIFASHIIEVVALIDLNCTLVLQCLQCRTSMMESFFIIKWHNWHRNE